MIKLSKEASSCLLLFSINKTEPGQMGPSAGFGHGVSVEPEKAKANQWFAAQLRRKETGARERGKE